MLSGMTPRLPSVAESSVRLFPSMERFWSNGATEKACIICRVRSTAKLVQLQTTHYLSTVSTILLLQHSITGPDSVTTSLCEQTSSYPSSRCPNLFFMFTLMLQTCIQHCVQSCGALTCIFSSLSVWLAETMSAFSPLSFLCRVLLLIPPSLVTVTGTAAADAALLSLNFSRFAPSSAWKKVMFLLAIRGGNRWCLYSSSLLTPKKVKHEGNLCVLLVLSVLLLLLSNCS